MSLLTYEDARPWAKSIKEKVLAREMPPWYIDKNVGIQHFKNDVSLSDEEIGPIVKWVDGGAPKRNPVHMWSITWSHCILTPSCYLQEDLTQTSSCERVIADFGGLPHYPGRNT